MGGKRVFPIKVKASGGGEVQRSQAEKVRNP
jgi:hypothetical protein